MGAASRSSEAPEPVSNPLSAKAAGPTKRPENDRMLGLTQLYPDPQDKAALQAKQIDIFVLHGLDARSDKTFIAWKVEGDKRLGDVNWLSDPDMLPARMPDSRILTYDWNANYDKVASQQTMLDHADTLLEQVLINRNRFERSGTPIIFIASCFGGILLSAAVVRSLELQHTRNESMRQIFDCCIGIVFMGTPFYGSWQMGSKTANLRIEAAMQAEPEDNIQYSRELTQYLKLGTKDTPSPLDNLIHRFEESINNPKYRIPCASLYETQPTKFAASLSRLPADHDQTAIDRTGEGIVVDKGSAALGGWDRSAQNMRHNMMHKFNNPENSAFEALCLRLDEYLEAADETIALRDRAWSMNKKRKPIEDSAGSGIKKRKPIEDNLKVWSERFSFPTMAHRRLELQQAQVAPGTCEWLFTHDKYMAWMTQDPEKSPTGTLFIQGKGGSGKSTLMNAAVDRSEATAKDLNLICLNYFFYGLSGVFPQNNPQGLYRSLLFQLLEKINRSPEVMALVGEWGPVEKASDEATQDIIFLKDKLSSLLGCLRDQRVYIFIDALDRCDKMEDDREAHLIDMVQYMKGLQRRKPLVSILFSIRDMAQLGSFLSAPAIEVTHYNQQDILAYLYDTLGYRESSQFRFGLIQILLDRSAGVFLWIKNVVTTLSLKEGSGQTKEELRQDVEQLPRGMRGLYRQFLDNLPLEDRAEALILLQLVQVGMRPMTILEVRSALEYARGTDDGPRGFGITEEAFEKRIRRICCGFLDVQVGEEPYGTFGLLGGGNFQPCNAPEDLRHFHHADQPTRPAPNLLLQFSHESVRDFLDEYGWGKLDAEDSSRSVALRAHLEVARLCMRAVGHGDDGALFLPYASQFWTTHARKADAIIDNGFQPPPFVTNCSFRDEDVVSLFKDHSINPKSTYYLQRADIARSELLDDDSSMLMLLAFEGCAALVARHGELCQHRDCHSSSTKVEAAFALALIRGCEKTVIAVKAIAQSRSIRLDPTAETDFTQGICPLQMVCQHNWHGVFKAVLDLEWDISSPATCLCFLESLKRANKHVVKDFLEKANDDIVDLLSWKTPQGYTAGHAAASTGRRDVFDMILKTVEEKMDDPVEVLNTKTNTGHTVLDIARMGKEISLDRHGEKREYDTIIKRLERRLKNRCSLEHG